MENTTLLIVDDDKELSKNLEGKFTRWGFRCLLAQDGIQALNILENDEVDIVLADQQMPRMNGLELLENIKTKYRDLPFIMLTAFATVDKAVSTIRQGADDYVQKPCDPDELLVIIRRSLSYSKLDKENKGLKSHLRDEYSFQNIVTKSSLMKEALEHAQKVADTSDTTVTILGESGTGKEVLARAIHFAGERMDKNLVAINCAGIPSNLLESELFGHVKGAFTGADSDREGKFDLAKGGTVLLDEIGDMPVDLQAKILRVLEEKTYERVGSNTSIKAEFRVISLTNKNLEELVKEGSFRGDLLHRINTFPIVLPPLRERQEDIPFLADYFLEMFNNKLNRKITGYSGGAIDILSEYGWPGNVRELKNCIERAVILSSSELIEPKHLNVSGPDPYPARNVDTDNDFIRFEIALKKEDVTMKNITKQILHNALKLCSNNKTKAAELLKINRKTFSRYDKG